MDNQFLAVCLHGLSPEHVHREGKRERERDLPLLIMPPILQDKDSTLVTSFSLKRLLNALSSNKVTFGFNIGIWRVGTTQFSLWLN